MTKMKHIIFGIAIAFISVFFFAYAIQAVYPGPEYEDYCEERPAVVIESAEECEGIGGKWTDYERDSLNMEIPGRCDRDFTCRKDYDDVRDAYERNVFFANLIIGIAVLIGAFFLAVEAVSTGLMGGAVLLIVYATMRYWGHLSDIWRTVVLGFSLALLIAFSYKKLKD